MIYQSPLPTSSNTKRRRKSGFLLASHAARFLSVAMLVVFLATATQADPIMIGPGGDLEDATNPDSAGIRLNIEPAFLVNLDAGEYNVLNSSYAVRQTGTGEVISFLAILTGGDPMIAQGNPTFETIWSSQPAVPPDGDSIFVVDYPIGSEQFTLNAATDVYAGSWHGDGAFIMFSNLVTITNHDNSPIKPTGAGEVVDAFSHGGLNNRTYGYGITVDDATPFTINGGGETYRQDFDDMGTGMGTPRGWNGTTPAGTSGRVAGLGLTDGFLTVPGNDDDGVLGLLNLGGNADSFGPAPDGFIPTWTAELAGANDLYGQDDAVADNAADRALGVSRENNDDAGELDFNIEIADNTMRAFVFDWDLEIWGGDPDAEFRSPEGPGMKVDVSVGGTSYVTMTENLLPGTSFDSIEDGGEAGHNATLIDGNVHSIRGMTSGIKEVSAADGAIGNMVHVNFNSNWNGATDDDPNGWMSAVDNVQFRALAPGDADANGVVDVADLLQLLGGQKFNQGVDGVTWEQGDFNADDQFNTGDLLAMLSFLSGTFPSDPYASEAGGASDAVADIIVNSETGEVTVDLAGHTVSAIIIESASEIFNGSEPEWDTTSQFPSTLPGELGNVLFTSTAAGVDELGAVISAEFLGRDKEFYLQDLDLNILIASEGGALTKGNVIVVPEPSTWMLLGLGSLLLVGWRQGAKRRSPGKN